MQNSIKAPRYTIAAIGCTLHRTATYFHKHAGVLYIAQSKQALAALLASRGIAQC
jgi:hypothetical protein